MSPAIHAPVAECPSRCQETNYETVSAICSGPMSNHWFSLIAHFYLQCVNCYSRYSFSFSFWHRRSTRRGTSFHRWVIRAVKMLPTEIRTTVMNMFCKKSSGRIRCYIFCSSVLSSFVFLFHRVTGGIPLECCLHRWLYFLLILL